MADPNLSSFIWSVADLLRGDYKQSEYGKVILPFTVLRRLDCVLESTKTAVLKEKEIRDKSGINPEPFLLKKSGQLFYNTSPLDLKKLMGDQDHIGENLRAYMQAFSPDLRAKLDSAGHYDDFEVDRVVEVELDPKAKQSDLLKALEPVTDRLMKRYKAAQEAMKIAKAKKDDNAAESAKNEMDALTLFKGDMGAFVRLYTFLSQIFDYGNTDIEKRAIFFKRLLPLLEFGREREGIDLSKVVLTHHHLKNLGKRTLPLGEGETPKLDPINEAGGGMVQEKEKIYMGELIAKLNELFGGDTTDRDQLVYANHVIRGKLLESATLRQQATNNTKEQFANSPDLMREFQNATMASLDAHTTMATTLLNSPKAQKAMLDILLNHSQLWEFLRGS